MAERSLVASIHQLVHAGLRLSHRLETFIEDIDFLDGNINRIAHNVSVTSAILTEIGETLKDGEQNGVASEDGIKTVSDIVHECYQLFGEIIMTLNKATRTSNGRLVLKKIRWSGLQSRAEIVRYRLDAIVTTLNLVLHVLQHATERKQ